MKTVKTKRVKLLSLLIAVCLLLPCALAGCQLQPSSPSDPPEGPPSEQPGEQPTPDKGDEPQEDEDMGNYVKLSEKGQSLFDATYRTMLDRLRENGYAQTSLTGAYSGMFIRDASIQAMAHLAAGDPDEAASILRFMAAFHAVKEAKYAFHIMNEPVVEEVYDYVEGFLSQQQAAGAVGATREGHSTALYKINMPSNGCATVIKAPFDSLKEVSFYLTLEGKTGEIVVSVGKQQGDDSVGSTRCSISELGSGNGWYTLVFDEPLVLERGEQYVISLWAENATGNIVSHGEIRGGTDYNYDVTAFGGWMKNSQALAYRLRPDVSIVGEHRAITQTFTSKGDHIDGIEVSIGCNEKVTVHATLVDAAGAALQQVTAQTTGGTLALDFGGILVEEGAQYGLSLWVEGGEALWNVGSTDGTSYRTADADKKDLGERYSLMVTPEYSGTRTEEKVVVGGTKTQELLLTEQLNTKFLSQVQLYLSSVGESAQEDTFTVTLLKGGREVHALTRPLSSLQGKATLQSFLFCFPLEVLDEDEAYAIRLSASRENSVCWYGCTIDGEVELSHRVSTCRLEPLSTKIQVDGHYMWVNAFAMFALECYDAYGDFVEQLYPMMASYARYFVENDYIHDNGLMYNPSYEHSRNGRYWESYDLITNVFSSEALHKMSKVAELLGESDDAALFADVADSLAAAIHTEMISEFDGKEIYTEMIALDEDGKVYKGFSFVNLAPIAADWYAVDEQIMANTYAAYLSVGTEKYSGVDMLGVVIALDDNDEVLLIGDHVIGKGLGWELYYLWETGNTERLEQVLSFVDKRSNDIYPETWRKDGSLADSGNQEQASWILYEVARITGLYRK